MDELHETRMGKTLIDRTIPQIVTALKNITIALNSVNDRLNDMNTLMDIRHMDDYINKYKSLKSTLSKVESLSRAQSESIEDRIIQNGIDKVRGK